MIYDEFFYGTIALISRFLAMWILGGMLYRQYKTLQLNLKDGSEELRYILFILLIILFIQNIFPVFIVIAEFLSADRVNPFMYWLNNALFSLFTAIILWIIYRKIIWLFIVIVDFLILWSIIAAGFFWIIVLGIIICSIKLFKKG